MDKMNKKKFDARYINRKKISIPHGRNRKKKLEARWRK